MATKLWSPGEFINPGDLRQPRTTAPAVQSALTNAGFETGDLTGWTVSDAAITVVNAGASFAFEGTHVIRHPDGLLGTYFIDNDNVVPVLPGQKIKLGCRYRRETNVNGRQAMAIEIRWFTAAMALIPIETYWEQAGGGTNVWYDPSVEGIAPATAAFAQARVRSFQTGTGGSHHQYFDSFSWDYIEPVAPTGLVYKAVQAAGGFTASTEPVWPITLGLTVVDNEVTWEAVIASQVTWEATPIMLSGATEPIWPIDMGATILDNTVVWKVVSRRVTDERCPNSKVVVIAASKVFAADEDIIPFSATTNPLDWSTKDDAGYIPFGLQVYGSNPVAAMGLYRSNLVAFNSEGFQMWQVDQDPANMAFLDGVPVGSTEHQSLQPVANDLMLLNPVGVRNVSIAGASTNLQADGVGEAIDSLTLEQIKLGLIPFALFWPAQGQYWLFFGAQAFVLTINEAKKRSWSRYVFPSVVDDWTLQGNDLYLRSGVKVWKVDDDMTQDDVYTVGNPSVISSELTPGGIDLSWTAIDVEGGAAIESYELYRSVGPGSTTYVLIATVDAADPLAYTDSTVSGNQTYNYRVVGVDTRGIYSVESNTTTEVWEDPDFGDVVVLLQAHTGALVEASGLPTVAVVGDGAISAVQAKFGTASFLNPGTNAESTDYVRLEDTTNGQGLFVFPGEFTIEGWYFVVGYNSDPFENLFANSINFPGAGFTQLAIHNTGGDHFLFWNSSAGSSLSSATDVPLGQWVFLAVTRDASDVLRLFIDGTVVASATKAGIVGALNPTKSSLDACRGHASDNSDANCYFDQIRITKACRYTANFTPPTAPFPTS